MASAIQPVGQTCTKRLRVPCTDCGDGDYSSIGYGVNKLQCQRTPQPHHRHRQDRGLHHAVYALWDSHHNRRCTAARCRCYYYLRSTYPLLLPLPRSHRHRTGHMRVPCVRPIIIVYYYYRIIRITIMSVRITRRYNPEFAVCGAVTTRLLPIW